MFHEGFDALPATDIVLKRELIYTNTLMATKWQSFGALSSGPLMLALAAPPASLARLVTAKETRAAGICGQRTRRH